MTQRQSKRGIYEFVFGALSTERDELLSTWKMLGFEPQAEGIFDAAAAERCYGHASPLISIRLKHPGCDTFGTGFVRLQLWDVLRNDGLGARRPMVTGSRWMGMYTEDILQLRDALASDDVQTTWAPWLSPLVNAPLAKPAPAVDFRTPFVGLRETLVFGKRLRLAFIQRAGFDRPGFGTFDRTSPYKTTEGSHASLVQPSNAFSTDFYKEAFGFETAPFGEPHDSGDEPPTIEALDLAPGEMFRIERTRSVDCPSGLLQVYSSYQANEDCRDLSRAGSGNLCLYSVRVRDLDRLVAFIRAADGAHLEARFEDEFGQPSVTFTAPDGCAWLAVADGA